MIPVDSSCNSFNDTINSRALNNLPASLLALGIASAAGYLPVGWLDSYQCSWRGISL